MRHSSLMSFLNGELEARDLWLQIEPEVRDCLAGCAKGGSGNVILTDGPNTLILRRHVTVFLAALADEKMPMEAASYVADALIMSDKFEWEDGAVADALFFLSDESAPLTSREVGLAQSRLEAAT